MCFVCFVSFGWYFYILFFVCQSFFYIKSLHFSKQEENLDIRGWVAAMASHVLNNEASHPSRIVKPPGTVSTSMSSPVPAAHLIPVSFNRNPAKRRIAFVLTDKTVCHILSPIKGECQKAVPKKGGARPSGMKSLPRTLSREKGASHAKLHHLQQEKIASKGQHRGLCAMQGKKLS